MIDKFIYFPSFSAGNVAYAMQKNQTLRGGLPIRFYSQDFPDEFRHPYFLMTAGSLYKDLNIREKFGLDADGIITLGDSGGYQIATGAIKWDVSIVPKILTWLETNSTIAMNLDIPPRRKYFGKFNECLDISKSNYKYFSENQSGKIDLLNVLQGDTELTYDKWYSEVKDFDFSGWGIGGGGGSIYRLMSSLCSLFTGKEQYKERNKYLHILGTSKISDFLILSQIQKSLVDINSKIQVTTDSSTPSRAVVYGLYYYDFDLKACTFRSLHVPKEFAKNNANRVKHSINKLTNENFSLPTIIPFDRELEGQVLMDDFINWTTEGCASLVLHNFMFFNHTISTINSFVGGDPYILEQVVSPEMFLLLQSIDEMIKAYENGTTPKIIFLKYKQLYINLSNNIQPAIEFNHNFF